MKAGPDRMSVFRCRHCGWVEPVSQPRRFRWSVPNCPRCGGAVELGGWRTRESGSAVIGIDGRGHPGDEVIEVRDDTEGRVLVRIRAQMSSFHPLIPSAVVILGLAICAWAVTFQSPGVYLGIAAGAAFMCFGGYVLSKYGQRLRAGPDNVMVKKRRRWSGEIGVSALGIHMEDGVRAELGAMQREDEAVPGVVLLKETEQLVLLLAVLLRERFGWDCVVERLWSMLQPEPPKRVEPAGTYEVSGRRRRGFIGKAMVSVALLANTVSWLILALSTNFPWWPAVLFGGLQIAFEVSSIVRLREDLAWTITVTVEQHVRVIRIEQQMAKSREVSFPAHCAAAWWPDGHDAPGGELVVFDFDGMVVERCRLPCSCDEGHRLADVITDCAEIAVEETDPLRPPQQQSAE